MAASVAQLPALYDHQISYQQHPLQYHQDFPPLVSAVSLTSSASPSSSNNINTHTEEAAKEDKERNRLHNAQSTSSSSKLISAQSKHEPNPALSTHPVDTPLAQPAGPLQPSRKMNTFHSSDYNTLKGGTQPTSASQGTPSTSLHAGNYYATTGPQNPYQQPTTFPNSFSASSLPFNYSNGPNGPSSPSTSNPYLSPPPLGPLALGPEQANYPPEVAAMMYTAYQQQQQHFNHQMAMMTAANNDPRRRAPSLPNTSYGHPQQNFYFQSAAPSQHAPLPLHPYMHPQQSQHPVYRQTQSTFAQSPHPHAPHHQAYASFSGAYPAPSVRGPGPGRARSPTAPSSSSSSTYATGTPGQYMIPPDVPFVMPSRSASPGRSSRSPSPAFLSPLEGPNQAPRRSGEVTPNNGRWQHPQSHSHSQSLPGQTHSQGRTISSSPSLAPSLSSNFALQNEVSPHVAFRSRTDSATSASSNANRSVSPAISDRASTPTRNVSHISTLDRPARTTPSTSSGIDPKQSTIRLVTQPGQASGHLVAAAGIPRKTSPLSQQSSLSSSAASNRSVTPTQSSLLIAADRPTDSGDECVVAAPPKTLGHRNTHSNASSGMTSSSSSNAHTLNSKTSGIFRTKLRKALSLAELNNNNNNGSSSTVGSNGKTVGRASMTSNSSSSDTSHSTAEPRTPPNGTSPVLPSSFGTSSTTNLHSSDFRQGLADNTSGTLPHNSGRRFGLLNSKMTSSTDNLSISSTVSSASLMLRKMASFGKLSRKNSVRSLSNIFNRSEKNPDHPTSDAVSEFGVPGAALSSGKDRKKGGAVAPSVAQVTVEIESGSSSGMTPAAALVKKHQEKERMQQEAEAAKKRAVVPSQNTPLPASSDSLKSKLLEKEKEKLKNASMKKGTVKTWGLKAFSRNASSSSLKEDAKATTSSSPSPPSSAAPSPIFDSPGNTSADTSNESHSPVQRNIPDIPSRKYNQEEPAFRPSLDNVQLDSWRKTTSSSASSAASLPVGAIQYGDDDIDSLSDDDNDEGFDDRTPRQSLEVLGDVEDGTYADWDGEPPNASFFDDDTASFKTSEGENTARLYHGASNVYDDGGLDGRSGQKIPDRPPPNARPTKGILKHASSYGQPMLSHPKPAFLRARASSYDAPHQTSPPNQPGRLAAFAQVLPSSAQVDGMEAHPVTSPRQDTTISSTISMQQIHSADVETDPSSAVHSYTGPYGNPSLNASAPVLAKPAAIPMTARSLTGPLMKRNISFANNLSVHITWPGSIYDRRGEVATCNRLTPQIAQRIKEELNAYKMEEMEVVSLFLRDTSK